MTSKTPLVDVITCLDSYNNSHSKGSSSLKSTIWNISIARRQKGGLGVGYNYSAADVREELRAHAILECSEEPVLGDEDTKPEKDSINHEEVGSFVLHFGGMPSKKAEHENNTVLESSDGYGLRQRKGKESKTIEKEWTEITFKDEQEEKLRKVDPLGEHTIFEHFLVSQIKKFFI